MKKIIIAFLPWLFSAFSYKAMAQETPKPEVKKETQEIIIRKNGDKEIKMIFEISGDKVMINGKPLMEFKDDDVTVNKKKIIIRDGENVWFGDGNNFSELEDKLGALAWTEDIRGEEKSHAFLGVVTENNDKGAKIVEVSEESAAEKAGLKKEDIITKVDDLKIDGPEMLSKTIKAKKAGEDVKIYYLRNGKEKSAKAVLKENKRTKKVFSYSSPDGSMKTLTIPSAPRLFDGDGNNFNFDMHSISGKQKLGIKIQDTEAENGVKVLDIEDNSAAATAGILKEDIITEISGVKIKNTDDAREQLQKNRDKSSYPLKALRNNKELNFEIKIPKKLKTANL